MSGRGESTPVLTSLRLLLVFLLVAQQPLLAATIVVDETTCTLVDAIHAANADSASGGCPAGSGADTIELTADVALTSIVEFDRGLPRVTSDIKVSGNDFKIARTGGPAFGLILVTPSVSLSLSDLTLQNGDAYAGGGIHNSGSLTLTNTTLSGNSAGILGGGIYNYFDATLTLTNTTLSGNSAFLGGGIFNYGVATLTSTTLSDNSAEAQGGGIYNYTAVTLTNTTLSGNSAGVRGGGIYNYFSATLTNTTLSGNSAGVQGGGINNAILATISLTNTTLSGNSAGTGGGISSLGSSFLSNTVLANSSGGNCSVLVFNGGNNLADDPTCGPFGAITGLDPVLSDNGGPTRTHALLAGSSAIDAAGNCPQATDQRGLSRLDGTCDSGAFEFGTEWAKLSQGGGVGLFGTTSDGKTAFWTEDDGSGIFHLRQRSVNGASPVLDLTFGAVFDPPGVVEAVITPDDSSIVFIAHWGGSSSVVFSVPVGGGEITVLSGFVNPDSLGVTPNGQFTFFFGDDDLFETSARELWVAAIGVADSAEQITQQGAFFGATTGVVFAEATPDGARIIYASDTVSPQFDLFSTFGILDFEEQETFTLSTGVTWAWIAPDNDKMYFTGDMFTPDLLNAHQTTIGSGSPEVQLNPTMDPGGIGVEFIQLTPDGSRLGFVGELLAPGETGTFTGSTAGPFPDAGFVSLSPPGVDAAPWINFNIDSDLAVWRGANFELWGGRADGAELPYLLHDVPDGDGIGVFTGTGFPAANQRALYPLFPALAPPITLHSVRVDGTELPDQVSAPVPAGDSMWGAVLPDPGERLVVMSSGPLADGGATADRLQVGPVRADLPVQQANPTADLVGGAAGVFAFDLAPGGNHVLFTQDAETNGVPELWAFGLMDSDGDGTPNTGDNCKFVAQAGQEPASFPGSAVVAVDKTTFAWGGLFGSGATSDVAWARGLLPLTAAYATSATGSVFDGSSMTDEDVPASGDGNWYLFKADCAGGDWGSAERNAALP